MSFTYSVHHLRAQDGAAVWVVARAMEDGGRLLACGEYMTQSAAIAAAQQLNAEQAEVAA
jgi:hypothetical protein